MIWLSQIGKLYDSSSFLDSHKNYRGICNIFCILSLIFCEFFVLFFFFNFFTLYKKIQNSLCCKWTSRSLRCYQVSTEIYWRFSMIVISFIFFDISCSMNNDFNVDDVYYIDLNYAWSSNIVKLIINSNDYKWRLWLSEIGHYKHNYRWNRLNCLLINTAPKDELIISIL